MQVRSPVGAQRYFHLRKYYWSLRKRVVPRRPFAVSFDGDLRLAVRPIDKMGRAVFLNGSSDPALASFLTQTLRPGMTFFDVGAHFGQYTLIAAKRVGRCGHVHSFEATGETFKELTTNIRLNCFSNITANHVAAFDSTGQLELNVCHSGAGEFNSLGVPLSGADSVYGKEIVDAITLDDYCREHQVEKIDVMKIDVEGAERNVLRGHQQFLRNAKALRIFCEFNETCCANLGTSCAELRVEFEALGFRIYRYNAIDASLAPEPRIDYYPETVNLVAIKE